MADPQDTQISPEDLMSRIRDHQDREAFGALFHLYGGRIKAFMLKKGASEAQAEDLVQDVMVTAWNRAELYDHSKATVSTWLFTIARNRRIDILRKDKRLEFSDSDPELVTEPEGQADHIVDQIRVGAEIRTALEQLPREQNEIVRLSFYEEKTHSEIAVLLDLPIGTVKSRIRLAMDKLRKLLGDLK